MPLERKRPLPAGRYWLDVFAKNADNWATWSKVMGKPGLDGQRATVEHTEHFEPVDGAEARDFVIFSTTGDLIWLDELGSPNIAGPEIRSSADTVQRPDEPKDILDQVRDKLDQASEGVASVQTAAKVVGGAVVVMGLGWLAWQLFGGKPKA